MDLEDWKSLEGHYFISSKGRIKRWFNNRGKYLKPHLTDKYYFITLSVNGNKHSYSLAKLVLETFVSKAPLKHRVAFKDGNSLNVELSNLYWKNLSQTKKQELTKQLSLF